MGVFGTLHTAMYASNDATARADKLADSVMNTMPSRMRKSKGGYSVSPPAVDILTKGGRDQTYTKREWRII